MSDSDSASVEKAGPSTPVVKVEEAASEGLDLGEKQMQELQDKILGLLERTQTRKATNFAIMSWNSWGAQRNTESPDDKIIPEYHKACSLPVSDLDELLAIYITEIRCRDGQEYLEDTVKGLSHGLQRYLRCFCQYYSKPATMLMKNYIQFPKFMTALQKRIKICRGKKKHAPSKGITRVQEEAFWENGTLGIDSAQALSDTVYFYTVKIFGITSSASLRFINLEDFTFSSDQYGDYVELNKNFALNDIQEPISSYNYCLEIASTGQLRHYANPDNPRTFYNIMCLYADLVNMAPKSDSFGFFLTPNKGLHFKSTAIGRNMLQRKFANIMRSNHLRGNFTNQALVQSFNPLLMQCGYKVKKFQKYTIQEHLDICRILDPPMGLINTSKLELTIAQHLFDKGLLTGHEGPTIEVPTTKEYPLCQSLQKFSQGNKRFKPTMAMADKAKPLLPTSIQLIPVTVNTLLQRDSAILQCVNAIQQTDSTSGHHEEQQLSVRSVGEDGSTDDECEEIENLVNIAIKQEPIDFEFENTSGDESTFLSVMDKELTEVTKPASRDKTVTSPIASCSNVQKKSETAVQKKVDTAKRARESEQGEKLSEKKLKSTKETAHMAVIEYTVTNDPDKKIFKQEINVIDDDQNTFSFSGTNKVGKTASDLDINLGDYLPENCTIKPEDIDLKRLVLPDGGKLVFKVKYCVPE